MTSEQVRIGELTLALKRSGDSGPAVVFVHGNSCSSRCFARQLEGALAARFRLVAIDLAGHGDSLPSPTPDATYSVPGHADALAAVAREANLGGAVWVGWSLGGHVVLEAVPQLPQPAGVLIFGTAPVGSAADVASGFQPNPALAVAFKADATDEEIAALAAAFVRPGTTPPAFFAEDFRRTDKRARSALAASVARNELRNELAIIAEMKRPLAIVHGKEEAVTNRSYLDTLRAPTLWRGAVQELSEAGHAAQWEAADRFDALLRAFAEDCQR